MQLRFESIGPCLLGRSSEKFTFENIDGTSIPIDEVPTPTLLLTTASWCAPCKAEIPAINKIAKHYRNKLKVILLFWDLQEGFEEMRSDYLSSIEMIPSKQKAVAPAKLEIGGFAHYPGFLTAYYIPKNNKIIAIHQGATVETKPTDDNKGITRREANRLNYERIKEQVQMLLALK